MKVKKFLELHKLKNVLVRLPDDVLEEYQNCCGGSKEMYIIGYKGGDFFLSPDSPSIVKRVEFPMPRSVNPMEILEWDIIMVKPEKSNYEKET